MPAPDAKALGETAKANFLSKNIQLPQKWESPGDQFPDAFKLEELVTAPNSPSTLFRETTLNKYHVDTAKKIGGQYKKYFEAVMAAISDAVDKWMKMTMITTVLINGPVGVLLPGGVVGPPLMPFILAKAPKKTDMETKYSTAIANAVSQQWQIWQTGLMGTLMYPAFAAFPGPMAPPTPNVPLPLIALSSAGEAALSAEALKGMMTSFLADPDGNHAPDLFDALAKAFNTIFQTFKASTMVQNVMGMGPIPTFAPPFVPVGPVVAGSVIPTPGVFK
jgi:hypothetical protein